MAIMNEKAHFDDSRDFVHATADNSYDPRLGASKTDPEYGRDVDELGVVCPPHTTERRLVTQIDLRVIPILSVLYLLAFLDRTNMANANVVVTGADGSKSSLTLDLHLPANGYNTALTIFFVPYILFEIPSNVILKRLSPRVWLSVCMFSFGLITCLQGIVESYGGLLATRFFLGLAEAGMFPGCFYLIGMWYRRSEAQKRFSFFFSSTSLAGAFGGLIASGISKMNGIRGYGAWRWIFILEGLLTCVVAIVFFFIIPNFPEEARWLRPDERQYLKRRLEADQGQKSALDRRITAKDVLNVFKDYKVIVAGFMYFGLIVPAYGYAFFAPGIIQSFGYSAIETQLHSVPPWAAAFGWAMFIAAISDATRHRFSFIIISCLASISGFAILLSSASSTIKYGSLFLVTSGTYGAMPIIICWFNMNLGGHHRRSVGSAWQIGFGNIGGIIATYIFLSKDAPGYKPGFGTALGFVCLAIISSCIYGVGCWMANRNREMMPTRVDLTERERIDLGDLSPEYRYLL